MRSVRKCNFGPLLGFTLLSLLGFIFFTSFLALVYFYPKYFHKFLISKCVDNGLADVKVFIILAAINAFAFFISFVQLMLMKPTSKKVILPVVLCTVATFMVLIAFDFYLEIRMAHPSDALKAQLTKTEKPAEGEEESKSRAKVGYLIIYIALCIVAGFVYVAFKDLEEYLRKQKAENEVNEIMISHIT